MTFTKTFSVEGIKDQGIPAGEVSEFISTAIAAGCGAHALVQVDVDKVRGGEDLVRLTVEIINQDGPAE